MSRRLHVTLSAPPTSGRVEPKGLDAIRDALTARQVAAAYQRGHTEGSRETLQGGVRILTTAAAQLDAARERAELDLPREVLELAVELADQILRLRLAEGAYDIERIVRSALAGGGTERGRCVVHLHPDDLARLDGARFREDTVLAANSDLAPGTVHVETKRGLLLRDPHEALEQVREALLEGLV